MSWMENQEGIYHVLDYRRVRFLQFVMLLFSVATFLLYALFLNCLCALSDELLSVLPLVASQVVSGILCTRAFQIAGARAAGKIEIVDPGNLPTSWTSATVSIQMPVLNQVFNHIIEEVDGNDTVVDDVMDFAWFVVIVWAVVTSAATALLGYNPLLCTSSSIVLAVCSAFCYYNGYSNNLDHGFEEDIEHLRYYVVTRIGYLQDQFSKETPVIQVHLLRNSNRIAIADIGLSLDPFNPQTPRIVYWIGLSKNRPEAIHVILPAVANSSIFGSLEKAPILENSNWTSKNPSPDSYHIARNPADISIGNPSTYVGRAVQPLQGVEDILSSMKFIYSQITFSSDTK